MSLPHRQPEMIDMKKKIGGGTYQGSGSNLASAVFTMTTDKPPAPDEIESVPDSWVEYAPSRASLCSSIEAVNIESTSVTNKDDSRLSPISLQSPHVEFESSLEQVKYRLARDIIVPSAEQPNKSTEWLWDWSGTTKVCNRNGGQIGSTLTTPPNSPEAGSSEIEFKSIKSGGKSSRKKTYKIFDLSIICRFDVLITLFFTNLMTGAVVYYYLTRVTKCEGTIHKAISEQYW